MKTDFFEELKKFIINEHQDDEYFLQYVRYYETLLQNQKVLDPLLSDMDVWKVNIHHDEDTTEGYTYGKYNIYLWDYVDKDTEEEDDDYSHNYDQKHPDYHYEIELTKDDRYWGYCDCVPEMKLYNEKYNCCGNGCDWVAPSFTLSKVEQNYGKFDGEEMDIWELEKKWEEYLDSYNKKIEQGRLEMIEEQLDRLEKEKNKLLNK